MSGYAAAANGDGYLFVRIPGILLVVRSLLLYVRAGFITNKDFRALHDEFRRMGDGSVPRTKQYADFCCCAMVGLLMHRRDALFPVVPVN